MEHSDHTCLLSETPVSRVSAWLLSRKRSLYCTIRKVRRAVSMTSDCVRMVNLHDRCEQLHQLNGNCVNVKWSLIKVVTM